MANHPNNNFVTVRATGTTLTTTGSSQRVAIPQTAAETLPRYVTLIADTVCYVKAGDSSVAATANDLMINGSASYLVLNVTGCSHIAAIQGTSGAKLNVQPLEDM